MIVKLLRGFTAVAGIIVVAALLWKQFGTSKANKLVDEANAFKEKAVGFSSQASPKLTELDTEANIAGYPGNRAQLESTVREVKDLYSNAAENFRAAAAKLDEASKQPVDTHVADYFAVQSQYFANNAVLVEGLGDYTALFADPTIETVDALKVKRAEFEKKVGELSTAVQDSNAKAEKIKAEYPDLLK